MTVPVPFDRDRPGAAAPAPHQESADLLGTNIVDCIELPLLVLGRDRALVSFNPAAASLLGLSASNLGQPLRRLPMLMAVKNLEEACEHVIAGGGSTQWEMRGGAGSSFLIRVGPCKAKDQQITGAVLTLTNVTALRESLEQAIREREYAKAIINTVIDPLVVLDEEFRVEAGNQAFHALFRASRDEGRGDRSYDSDFDALRELLRRSHATTGQFEPLEVEHELESIGRRTLLLNARRLSRSGELHPRFLVAIQDITERTSAEQARVKLLEELQETLRYNEIFAAILAHDLRNPLSAIMMGAQVLIRRYEGGRDAVAARPVSRILSSGERMARMIDQLLDFTRARSGGGLSVSRRSLDLGGLAAQIAEEFEGSAPQRISFSTTGCAVGKWDGDRLAQVISNLLGNAVEHGEGSQPIRLEVDGTDPETVLVVVANAGVIPEMARGTLFQPFRGAATTHYARKSKGLGLGLFIAKQVVVAHGGTISVTSTKERGTTFVVQLPRRGADDPSVSSDAGRGAPAEGPGAAHGWVAPDDSPPVADSA